MGELGWNLQRYRDASIEEFNLACGGYWRNWERNVGVIMREIGYILITGNPYIKKSSKPSSIYEYMKFSIDKKKKEPLTKEEEEFLAREIWQIKNLKRS